VDLEQRLLEVESIAPAVPIVVLSALTGDHVADLTPFLQAGHTAVVLGSSGVGKSTLVNTLLGEQRQATAAVRDDDSRGRHTTTHRELFALLGGALLIDTPGIRSLEVAGADVGVDVAFDDIADLASACRFSDCRHEGEPGCAVRAAVDDGRLSNDRLASHRKLERELAHAERKGDARARAAETKKWKSIHKAVARQMHAKYGDLG
jgi:ribosome biogenesis GTPase